MKTTYRRINDALRALQPLMQIKGLSGRTQIALMRHWRSLAAEGTVYGDAEMAAVRAFGSLRDDGKTVKFKSPDAERAYLERIAEMLNAETEISPVSITDDAALYEHTTPDTWAALDGFIVMEEGGNK